MMSIDFAAAAGVYFNLRPAHRRPRGALDFRRFDTLAEAIRFVVEELRPGAHGASIEVGDQRLEMEEIRRLYDSDAYPLERRRS